MVFIQAVQVFSILNHILSFFFVRFFDIWLSVQIFPLAYFVFVKQINF